MGAPLTSQDLEDYGYKVKDVQKINFFIHTLCFILSIILVTIIYYIKEY